MDGSGGQRLPHDSHQVTQDQDAPMVRGKHLVKEYLDLLRCHGVGPLAGELLEEEEDHVELLRDPRAPELPQDLGPTATRWARVPAHHL